MAQIEFCNVSKSFGQVKAANGLDLQIEEGQVYALLGHNGAGKTTALRLLLGLLKPDGGQVSVFGHDPAVQGDAVRGMCGVLAEDVGLYEPLSVRDNLLYYADLYGMPRPEACRRMEELLARFDLLDKMLLPVKGFSTGMKKKVALIRAMLHRPRILLLDEPTNGLDPVSTADLRAILAELAAQQNTTILMTTHNLEEVQKLCQGISILRQGQNVFTGSIAALERSHTYTENGRFSLEKLYLDLEARGQNG